MQRVNLDSAGPAVKQFMRSLPIDRDDIELELDGKVLCKVTRPNKLCDAEKTALSRKGVELIEQARERNKSVPASVIAREVEDAVQTVRGRQ
jgi:hypothetical protein